MQNINLRKMTRRAVLGIAAFALVVAALAGTLVADVDAAGQHVETTYYADAAKTQPVGIRIQTCNGNVLRYGSVSRFQDSFSYPCF